MIGSLKGALAEDSIKTSSTIGTNATNIMANIIKARMPLSHLGKGNVRQSETLNS